jgi:hypothetical protein
MRVGVDFLRERRNSFYKPIDTDFFQALLPPYILCKRASARPRFSCALADVPLIGPHPMPRFLQTAPGTTAHRCLFTVFPLLLCDWPTVARSPSGPLIGIGNLSSAHVAL